MYLNSIGVLDMGKFEREFEGLCEEDMLGVLIRD